jgi:hypothetical protein
MWNLAQPTGLKAYAYSDSPCSGEEQGCILAKTVLTIKVDIVISGVWNRLQNVQGKQAFSYELDSSFVTKMLLPSSLCLLYSGFKLFHAESGIMTPLPQLTR